MAKGRDAQKTEKKKAEKTLKEKRKDKKEKKSKKDLFWLLLISTGYIPLASSALSYSQVRLSPITPPPSDLVGIFQRNQAIYSASKIPQEHKKRVVAPCSSPHIQQCTQAIPGQVLLGNHLTTACQLSWTDTLFDIPTLFLLDHIQFHRAALDCPFHPTTKGQWSGIGSLTLFVSRRL